MENSDDAGVFVINEDMALVQTVDFIPPIIDDPYYYGAIAATNSISDVYAMGGTPLTALNILCFPADTLPAEILTQILKGATDKIIEAGVVLVGGHSVIDKEPKFGLAVTGTIHPQKVIRNSGAQPGDYLVLTKPIGTGVITTAAKQEKTDTAVIETAVKWMTQLNKSASLAMQKVGVHAATDVTGFGLLGHALEMATGSGVSLKIEVAQVPWMEGAVALAQAGFFSGGSRRNWKYVEKSLLITRPIDEPILGLLADAQTSGGLLMAVAEDKLEALLAALNENQVPLGAVIGRAVPRESQPLILI